MPRNESYFIAINIPEPLRSEIENIKKDISEKYRTRSVLKSPPHITIIPPFFWGNESELLDLVNHYSYPAFEIRLNGFDSFTAKVVYIAIKEDPHIPGLHQHFSSFFYGKYPSLRKKDPYPFHPHITIGNRDWKKEDFEQCRQEMKNRKFESSFQFRKLSLLKNVNGLWIDLSPGII